MDHTVRICIFVCLISFVKSDPKCPELKPVRHFNFTAMASGVWYDLARYQESTIEKASTGNQYTFSTRTGPSVFFRADELLDGKLNTFNGTMKLVDNAGDTAQLVYDVNEEGGILVYLDIVAIEYDNYEILYYCKYDDKTQKRTEFAWISSRKPGADKKTIDKINKFIATSNIIDPKKLFWITDESHQKVAKLLKNNN